MFIVAAAFLAFSPTIGFDFLRYDDEIYISTNPHLRPLTLDTVIWTFSHSYFQSYTPLTLLSHALDAAVWGGDPRGHHLSNVILHALNSGLLLILAFLVLSRVIRRKDGSADVQAGLVGAITTAFLFALHPLRVESVAWVSDRKDLLMGFFLLLSFLTYLLFALRGESTGRGKWFRLTLGFLILAVLSKTPAIAGPFAMLGLDILLGRHQETGFKRLFQEKLPLFVVTIVGGALAVAAAHGAKPHRTVQQMGMLGKALLPLYSPAFFVGKLLWPLILSPVYPAPETGLLILCAVASLLITVTAVFLHVRRRSPLLLAAWGSYLCLLAPTLAGAYAGIQPWADRYTYIPLVPLVMLAGSGAGVLWSRVSGTGRQKMVLGALGVLMALNATLTLRQLPYWKDSVTLWRYAQIHAPASGPLLLVPLGVAYYHAGELDSAIAVFKRAASLEPGFPQTYFSLGEAYAAKGDLSAAAESYFAVLRRDSTHLGAANNLADIYLQSGSVDRALGIYRELAQRYPDEAQIRNNLGFALMRKGDVAGAEEAYRQAIRLAPGWKSPRVNLGALYLNTGKGDKAVEILESAARLEPDDPGINYNLALALEAQNRLGEAENAYRRALMASPRYVDAWINLGNLIGRMGRLQEARAMYRQVVASIPGSAELCLNLAGIYNALGEKDSALASLQEAIRRKPDFAPAHYAMGLFYREAGDSAAARHSLQIASRYGSREAAALLQSRQPPQPIRR